MDRINRLFYYKNKLKRSLEKWDGAKIPMN